MNDIKNSHTHSQPRPRNRLKLALLLLVLSTPMTAAWALFQWPELIPENRVAHGKLLPDVANLYQWSAQNFEQQDPAGQYWKLVQICTVECREDIYWRVHRALGRDAERLSRWRLGAAGQPEKLPGEVIVQTDLDAFADFVPQQYSLLIADPQGHVVLAYSSPIVEKEVLKDLRYLLRRNPAKPSYFVEQPNIVSGGQDDHE